MDKLINDLVYDFVIQGHTIEEIVKKHNLNKAKIKQIINSERLFEGKHKSHFTFWSALSKFYKTLL